MNCPKCGLQTLSEQKFCRSCGASLQMITKPLAEHATVADLQRTPANILKDEEQTAHRPVPWGFIIMFIGVAIGVIGKKLMHEEIFTVVGVLIALAGMFLTAYPSLSPAPNKKYQSRPPPHEEALTHAQPKKVLPQGNKIEYLASITERTTDLLENSAATRPTQRDDKEL